MRVLSLFDGISCGMVALERAGIEVEKYVAYEIEESAILISKKNYPQIIHKGDVFKAVYTEGEFDLLIGGSPCTHWSISKRGRETTASGLGWELFQQYVRALREAKPKYFLYENNESMSDAIKESITQELGVEPVMINSADFSCQIRKRYYWTNIPFVKEWEKSNLTIKDVIFEHDYHIIDFSKHKDTVKWNKSNTICYWDTSGKGYYSQSNRCNLTNTKINTLRTSGTNHIFLEDYKCRKIHPVEAERFQTLPDNYTSGISKGNRIKACGNGWTVDVIVHILKGLKDEN